jgi:hypothetical protein
VNPSSDRNFGTKLKILEAVRLTLSPLHAQNWDSRPNWLRLGHLSFAIQSGWIAPDLPIRITLAHLRALKSAPLPPPVVNFHFGP